MHQPSAAVAGRPPRAVWCALAWAVGAGSIGCAHAADFGHARMLSAPGQPLRIQLPIKGVSPAEAETLTIQAAPAAAWRQAGLVPPVPLAQLQVHVQDPLRPGAPRLVQIGSDHPFEGTLADVLLQIQSAAGEQQYQVSVLAASGHGAAVNAPVLTGQKANAGQASDRHRSGTQGTDAQTPAHERTITVRRGDTLFALARRYADPKVSVYQFLMAVQRANTHAFIHQNVNLVRAGARLRIPDQATMLSISRADARAQFQVQLDAFHSGRYPTSQAGDAAAPVIDPAPQPALARTHRDEAETGSGTVSDPVPVEKGPIPLRDQLRLTPTSDDQARLGQNEGGTGLGATDHRAPASGGAGGGASPGMAGADARGVANAAPIERAGQASLQAGGESSGAVDHAARSGFAAQSMDDARAQDSATAQSHALRDAEDHVSRLKESVAELDAALKARGREAKSLLSKGAHVVGATIGHVSEVVSQASHEAADQAEAGQATDSRPTDQNAQLSQGTQERVSWLQEHVLSVLIAVLLVIIGFLVWLLRRATHLREISHETPHVTEAMVREKLEGIDLALDTPPDAKTARGDPPTGS